MALCTTCSVLPLLPRTGANPAGEASPAPQPLGAAPWAQFLAQLISHKLITGAHTTANKTEAPGGAGTWPSEKSGEARLEVRSQVSRHWTGTVPGVICGPRALVSLLPLLIARLTLEPSSVCLSCFITISS